MSILKSTENLADAYISERHNPKKYKRAKIGWYLRIMLSIGNYYSTIMDYEKYFGKGRRDLNFVILTRIIKKILWKIFNFFFDWGKISKIIPKQGSVHIVDGQNEVTDPNAEFALLIKFFGLDPSLIEFEYNESKGFYCLGTWDYDFIDYFSSSPNWTVQSTTPSYPLRTFKSESFWGKNYSFQRPYFE